MVVRVRLRLRHEGTGTSTVITALVNAGAEADAPVLLVPPSVAEALGLWPTVDLHSVRVAELTGESVGYLLQHTVTVELLDEQGNPLSSARAFLIVSPGTEEACISDYLAEELGIVIVYPRRGYWRHVRDPEHVLRPSAEV